MTASFEPQKPINNALGKLPIIKLLVDHGAQVTGEDLFSILNRSGNNFEAADYIMQKCGDKIDLNAKCVFGMTTILQQMVQNKEVERVEWLLAHGANAKETTTDPQLQQVPLFSTVCEKNDANNPKSLKILESFLKHGADANAVCKIPGGQVSVLGKCINADLYDHALMLLQHGAKGDAVDSAGCPLLYTLAERSAAPENAGKQDKLLQVADALVKNGAKTSQKAKGCAALKSWAKETPGGKPRVSAEMLKWIEAH